MACPRPRSGYTTSPPLAGLHMLEKGDFMTSVTIFGAGNMATAIDAVVRRARRS
jgi:hypothetical protein